MVMIKIERKYQKGKKAEVWCDKLFYHGKNSGRFLQNERGSSQKFVGDIKLTNSTYDMKSQLHTCLLPR
jgi:hypothetical protein